jgi:hypothetical protein
MRMLVIVIVVGVFLSKPSQKRRLVGVVHTMLAILSYFTISGRRLVRVAILITVSLFPFHPLSNHCFVLLFQAVSFGKIAGYAKKSGKESCFETFY